MKPIRNSTKAIIQRSGHLLLTQNIDQEGLFYLFPGGGQEHGEQLNEALIRECMEEIGQNVVVGELTHIREYIGANHQFSLVDGDIHQVEFYFACELEHEADTFIGTNPDEYQVGVEWIAIDKLHEIRLYPEQLGHILQGKRPAVCYLGDTN
ncbi:NUDIX domain-containing protein [Paenibacillus sp. UMB4589-SE434]|uniref:NUDIX domain-containing protein n=1 Tax=Paenibacillus sp. UMB4589-SE434 TaxID=3046314 RepID=UPI002551946B|nr:NUDIX domain-containing protein [Paenibacillus sp. UMB4589-SE434]MDK8179230.1 NUDIX domain-containing protein [Paenibacillus sp. UMB4589-SE434]